MSPDALSTHTRSAKGANPMRPKSMHLRITSCQTGGVIFDGFVTSFYSDGVVYRYVAQGLTQTMETIGIRVELEP